MVPRVRVGFLQRVWAHLLPEGVEVSLDGGLGKHIGDGVVVGLGVLVLVEQECVALGGEDAGNPGVVV